MNRSRISVVMTTFNGEEHVEKQLDSLLNQTRLPDEVLIFDDRSEDSTVRIVEQFMDCHHPEGWTMEINRKRLGWKRNFIEGMKKATGELIFLCDQDDIWYSSKIYGMTEMMEKDSRILLLACDYRVVYEEGAIRAKVYRKNREEKRGDFSRYIFTKHFFMNPNPGCTYVLRKDFLEEVQDYWIPEAPHDEFLWLMATIRDGAFFCNKTLMDYIRYAGNTYGVRYKDIQLQKENLAYISKMLEKMREYIQANRDLITDDKQQTVINAEVWCEKRKKLMRTRNPVRWLGLMPWWGYYNSAKNCLSDLYLVLFGKFRRKNV